MNHHMPMQRREYKSERIRRELTTARLARHDLDDKDDLSRAAYFCELVGNYTAQNALLNRGAEILPREKASNIGINSQGGELVPSLVADRVIELRQLPVSCANTPPPGRLCVAMKCPCRVVRPA